MAIVYVDSVEEARSFYVEELGFQHLMGMLGKDGMLDYCSFTLGGAAVMFMRPAQAMPGTAAARGKRPVEFYIEVDGVDEYCERLKRRKIPLASPLKDQWWGDRTFTITDPFGYRLWFYETVNEARPPQGAKLI